MSLPKMKDLPENSASHAYPWWIVVGRRDDGRHVPARINAQDSYMARAEFERRFQTLAVASIAREVYRNELVG